MKIFIHTLLVSTSLLVATTGVRWIFWGHRSAPAKSEDVVFSFHPQVEKKISWSAPQKEAILQKIEEAISEANVSKQDEALAVNEVSEPKVVPKISSELVKTESLSSVLQVSNPSQCEYVVEAGDRLDLISMKFYGTHRRHQDILSANPGLDAKRLKPGLKLVIPDIRMGLPVQPVVFVQRSRPLTREYVVQAKDVLGSIANKELGSSRWSAKILEVNPGLDPLKLKPGQKINLPVLGLTQNN